MLNLLTHTRKYGKIILARRSSGSTTKSGLQAYFGQYICPNCMDTRRSGSLEQYGWGNSISQSGQGSERPESSTLPLNTVDTLGVLLCLSKIVTTLRKLRKQLYTSFGVSLSKKLNPKQQQPNRRNRARFYSTPMASLLAYLRYPIDEKPGKRHKVSRACYKIRQDDQAGSMPGLHQETDRQQSTGYRRSSLEWI